MSITHLIQSIVPQVRTAYATATPDTKFLRMHAEFGPLPVTTSVYPVYQTITFQVTVAASTPEWDGLVNLTPFWQYHRDPATGLDYGVGVGGLNDVQLERIGPRTWQGVFTESKLSEPGLTPPHSNITNRFYPYADGVDIFSVVDVGIEAGDSSNRRPTRVLGPFTDLLITRDVQIYTSAPVTPTAVLTATVDASNRQDTAALVQLSFPQAGIDTSFTNNPRWSFGDGSNTVSSARTPAQTSQFVKPGSYIATLTWDTLQTVNVFETATLTAGYSSNHGTQWGVRWETQGLTNTPQQWTVVAPAVPAPGSAAADCDVVLRILGPGNVDALLAKAPRNSDNTPQSSWSFINTSGIDTPTLYVYDRTGTGSNLTADQILISRTYQKTVYGTPFVASATYVVPPLTVTPAPTTVLPIYGTLTEYLTGTKVVFG